MGWWWMMLEHRGDLWKRSGVCLEGLGRVFGGKRARWRVQSHVQPPPTPAVSYLYHLVSACISSTPCYVCLNSHFRDPKWRPADPCLKSAKLKLSSNLGFDLEKPMRPCCDMKFAMERVLLSIYRGGVPSLKQHTNPPTHRANPTLPGVTTTTPFAIIIHSVSATITTITTISASDVLISSVRFQL